MTSTSTSTALLEALMTSNGIGVGIGLGIFRGRRGAERGMGLVREREESKEAATQERRFIQMGAGGGAGERSD